MSEQSIAGVGARIVPRLCGLYAGLIAVNLAAWIWALLLFHNQPAQMGLALLAYGFGLRHAVDADHIAAIDNTTRKLMQAGQRPIATGLFFALGHSSVVVMAAACVAMGVSALSTRIGLLHDLGGVFGTGVSALFLFAIGAVNLLTLISIGRDIVRLRRRESVGPTVQTGGLLTRLGRPLFRLIGRSWHMLPLGFLFGLGFDTATEISLLGLSAQEMHNGAAIGTVMVFPALFAAGMSLIDTTDGILMLYVYDWAFVQPVRKLYYSFTITLLSVAAALLIGLVELLALLGGASDHHGRLWRLPDLLDSGSDRIGMTVIGLFLLTWTGFMMAWRYAPSRQTKP